MLYFPLPGTRLHGKTSHQDLYQRLCYYRMDPLSPRCFRPVYLRQTILLFFLYERPAQYPHHTYGAV